MPSLCVIAHVGGLCTFNTIPASAAAWFARNSQLSSHYTVKKVGEVVLHLHLVAQDQFSLGVCVCVCLHVTDSVFSCQ
jgi:hypothetical protein